MRSENRGNEHQYAFSPYSIHLQKPQILLVLIILSSFPSDDRDWMVIFVVFFPLRFVITAEMYELDIKAFVANSVIILDSK